MAEKSLSNTLHSIAGAWNPNIAQAHANERQLDLKEAQLDQNQRTADYNKVLKQIEIWDKTDEHIAKGIADRSIDPAAGEASRARIRAVKSEALARIGVQMPEFETNAQPDPEEGRNDFETSQIRMRELNEAQAQTNDANELQRITQEKAQLQSVIDKATTSKPTMIDTGRSIIAVDNDGNPLYDYEKDEPFRAPTADAAQRVKIIDLETNKSVGSWPANKVPEKYNGNPRYDSQKIGSGTKTTMTYGPDGWKKVTEDASSVVVPPTKTVQSVLQKDAIKQAETRHDLQAIKDSFNEDYLTVEHKVWVGVHNFFDKFGSVRDKLVPENKKKELRKVARFKRRSYAMLNKYIQMITGAAMGIQEAERIRRAVPDLENDGPTQFLEKLEDALALGKQAELRTYQRMHGLSPSDRNDPKKYTGIVTDIELVNDEFDVLMEERIEAASEVYGDEQIPLDDLEEIRRNAFRETLLEDFHVPEEEIGRFGGR